MATDTGKLGVGMVKLEWTPDGGAQRDLGFIKAAAIEPVITFIQHYANRSGIKVLDKEAAVQKELRIPFTFEEINEDNLVDFFFGDAPVGGVFSPLMNPVRLGALTLTYDPTSQEKPYQKFVWVIAKAHIKATGSFTFNDADWLGADMVIEILYDADEPTKPYGEITVTTES